MKKAEIIRHKVTTYYDGEKMGVDFFNSEQEALKKINECCKKNSHITKKYDKTVEHIIINENDDTIKTFCDTF